MCIYVVYLINKIILKSFRGSCWTVKILATVDHFIKVYQYTVVPEVMPKRHVMTGGRVSDEADDTDVATLAVSTRTPGNTLYLLFELDQR